MLIFPSQGTLLSWDIMAEILYKDNPFDVFVLLDSCDSGCASLSFDPSNDNTIHKNITILSATSWSCTTPAHGNDTLTKRSAGTISDLMIKNQTITASSVYEELQHAAVVTGVGRPMLHHAGKVIEDMTLSRGNRARFKSLHMCSQAWTLQGRAIPETALGHMFAVVLPSHATGPDGRGEILCAEWIPWYKNAKVRDVIEGWHCLFGPHSEYVVRMLYFDELLDPEAEFIGALQRIAADHIRPESERTCWVIEAHIEDACNPFGRILRGHLPRRSGVQNFAEYVCERPDVLDMMAKFQPLTGDAEVALRHIIKHHEQTHQEMYAVDEDEEAPAAKRPRP